MLIVSRLALLSFLMSTIFKYALVELHPVSGISSGH